VLRHPALGAAPVRVASDLDRDACSAGDDLDVSVRTVEVQRAAVGDVESAFDDVGEGAGREKESDRENYRTTHEASIGWRLAVGGKPTALLVHTPRFAKSLSRGGVASRQPPTANC
jgi:hypothetical protein